MTAMAATLTAFLACALAWASRRSFGMADCGALHARIDARNPGPVAGMALVLAYRAFPVDL